MLTIIVINISSGCIIMSVHCFQLPVQATALMSKPKRIFQITFSFVVVEAKLSIVQHWSTRIH